MITKNLIEHPRGLEEKFIDLSYKYPTNKDILQSAIPVKESSYIRSKYLLEYVVALFSSILLLVPLLVTALLIKLESRGPVFFKQTRYGQKGKPFQVYKFRTMVNGAHKLQAKYAEMNEMKGGKLFKSDHDPRVTRLGKILRKFSIDEIPQLINILRGEMTLIGPRPISTPIEEYKPHQLQRFAVKPGLGAIWQAYYRGETDFDEWMSMDIYYVENISFKLDTKLFYSILNNVITGTGAR